MNKNFIMECFDIIDKIKLNSIVAIEKEDTEMRYKLIYNEYEWYELLCLDEENAIWDDGDTIKDIKEHLLCSAIRCSYQKIRLVKE